MRKAEIEYNSELKELEKLQARLERNRKSLEKKIAQAEKMGVVDWTREDYTNFIENVETVGQEEGYICSMIKNKDDIKKNSAYLDLRHAENEFKDTERQIARCEERLAKKKVEADKVKAEDEKNFVDINEIPKAFLEAKAYLVEEWTAWDIQKREYIRQLKRELPHKEFRNMIKYSTEQEYNRTDEEFRKLNEKEAEAWLLDLYRRVRKITGKVIDASGIKWGGKCLDGIVIGEQGRAEVTTIYAGGYNIQRLHLRTLVKKF